LFLVLSSFCYAYSEWQTSTYATQEGLQIIYPKIDFYKYTFDNIIFNFNILDANNSNLNNSNTNCNIFLYQSNGTRLINQSLQWDNSNFYFIWDITNYSSPSTYYYTIFCNSTIGKGVMSNNFELNYFGRNPIFNTNYLAIVVCLIGICFILIFVSNNLDERHGILKLLLLSFIVLFFIVFGVVMLTMMRGGDLDLNSLLVFKTTTWLLRIFFAYILIFLLIVIFDKLGMLAGIKSFMRMK
jgi:hypothetical protein